MAFCIPALIKLSLILELFAFSHYLLIVKYFKLKLLAFEFQAKDLFKLPLLSCYRFPFWLVSLLNTLSFLLISTKSTINIWQKMPSCQQKFVRNGLESYLRDEASLVLVKLWVSFVYQENLNRLLFFKKTCSWFLLK